MPYLKDELKGFVPVEQASEIIKKVARGSSVIRLSRLEQMTSDTKKIPVMTNGAGAYWVGEGQRIGASGATWIFPELRAKKLAVIIPVTKEKLNDATIDVFSELRENIAEAFYEAFDSAALFGYNSPFSSNILSSCAKVEITDGSFDLASADVMAKVEEAGYDVNGFAAKIGVKNSLRKLRDANGAPIFITGTDQNELYGQPIEFVRNGAWKDDQAELIAGEWKYSLVGIRDDIEYEILTEATLQNTLDADGKPLSLAEQDMVAIKATMRIGYLCVKPEAFAALVPVLPGTSILGQNETTYGKKVSELIGNDVKILADGSVVGTFNYVSGYTKFSSKKEEQDGYFFPIKLDEKYKGKTVTAKRTSGSGGEEKTSSDDLFWTLKLTDGKDTVYSFKADNEPIFTLSFANIKYNQEE